MDGYDYEWRVTAGDRALRAVFGIHIARVACAYDLSVETELERTRDLRAVGTGQGVRVFSLMQ